MEQGATSQPGVTTRARSRAIPPASRGTLPRDLPRPKTTEHDQPKEIGDKSRREEHQKIPKKDLMNLEMKTRGLAHLEDPRKKRLINRLRHEPMPKGFRMPKFRTFDGMGDPINHLKVYDSQLSFWANEDDVYVRAFPSSLSGAALKWFHKLPPNSIDC
ncbi:hypothetical protein LIER_40007 [Lithospermum erythrorhizon]|uniref:Retrotransposon gag domain-containing protein n=1 Tax=Lithospermum erythrorhizon TaxID=34254 RepID=A0AAV3QRH9_LITER